MDNKTMQEKVNRFEDICFRLRDLYEKKKQRLRR